MSLIMRQPSYEVVSQLLLSMLDSEETLSRALTLLLRRHPALVNARYPTHDASGAKMPARGAGGSLLQLIVRLFLPRGAAAG